MDHLCNLCLVFVMLSRLFIAALWSPAGKGPTSWFLLVMFNCVFVTFPCGILGQVWYLIVSIPDLCRLYYFVNNKVPDFTYFDISCITTEQEGSVNNLLDTSKATGCDGIGPEIIKLAANCLSPVA